MGWTPHSARAPPVRPCWCCCSPPFLLSLSAFSEASPESRCVWERPHGLCPQGEALARRTLLCWESVCGQTWGLLAQGLGDFSLASQDSLFSLFFWETSACLEASLPQLLFATDFVFSVACLLLGAEARWPEPFLAADVFSGTALVSHLATWLLLCPCHRTVPCGGAAHGSCCRIPLLHGDSSEFRSNERVCSRDGDSRVSAEPQSWDVAPALSVALSCSPSLSPLIP